MGGIEDAGPEIDDGGSAFPGTRRYHGADMNQEGCTKRELFAAIIAAGSPVAGLTAGTDVKDVPDAVADQAVKIADALLRRLRRP